jgi:hypothetical protein
MYSPRTPGAGIAGAQTSLGGDDAASATAGPLRQYSAVERLLHAPGNGP